MPPSALSRIACIVGLGLVALTGRRLPAADLRNVLTDYAITSWSTRDGLPPGNVWALAQDAAGYLWVGSDAGLLRFDGTRFILWAADDPQFAQRPVRSLYSAKDGTLWVGFGDRGGVGRIRQGHTSSFGEPHGLPNGAVMVLTEDATGTLLAGGDAGLFTLTNDRWIELPGEFGLPDMAIYSAFSDDQGNFYVGTEVGVFRRAGDQSRFLQVERFAAEGPIGTTTRDVLGSRRSFTEAASGRVLATVGQFPRSFVQDWSGRVIVNDWNTGYRPVGRDSSRVDGVDEGRGYRLLLDRHRNLWVGTIGQGLWRIRHDDGVDRLRTERATALTGLLSDGIGALIEDRDGNIWAGTTEGLNRLTPRRISQLTTYGIVVGIDLTRDGSVWAGTLDELIRFPGGKETQAVGFPLHDARFRIMHADAGGSLWVATDRYLARLPPGGKKLVPLPQDQSLSRIDLLASDRGGRLWSFASNEGLAFWKDGVLQRVPLPLPDEGRGASMSVLYSDRLGRLWAALTDGRVLVRDPSGTFKIYGADHGLTAGICRQIFEDSDGVLWLAATGGLSKLTGDRFMTVRSDRALPANDLTAIAEDDDGHLWVGSGFGILRISKNEFDAVANGSLLAFQYNLFGRADGLAGMPHAYDNNRRVVRAADGRLWYVTSRGLSMLDPRAFRAPSAVAPVTIEQVSADGRVFAVAPELRLPARTSRLEIVYSQLNLGTQARTRFRYRLEGFDADWVDAGTRRQAFYTNLPPRTYTFHVMAGSANTTWSEPAAVWSFSIQPMFYQTTWFYAAAAMATAVLMWGAYQLRLRQMRQQFALVLRERVRLSREIHDTLLQSLVGVALQFDAVAADVESSSARTQRQFVRMRKQVEEYIREARQTIWDLRLPSVQERTLTATMRDLGEQATTGTATRFIFEVTGEETQCSPKVQEQLMRIGREAISNSLRHARPDHIRMSVSYEPDRIVLQIADDGKGFDSSRLRGNEADHYGLITMRERAEELNGSLEIESELSRGTRIRATVPLRAAA